MITEDYVSFETAKLLKEKGFDCNTNCYYIEDFKDLYYSPIRQNHNKRIINNEFDIDINIPSGKMSAPTLQMTMKWLREVHKIFISIQQHMDMSYVWYAYEDGAPKGWDRESHNSTYEEACKAAIKYCLENLI